MHASLTYRPLPPQNPAEFLRPYPSIYARYEEIHSVQPLKGLRNPRAAISYRALAPDGAGFCCRICTGTSESHPTAHYSLLTANSTYTFSAKEKDAETGLSYFGSRYYSSDLSVWLSVDPMAGKYPHQSNYVYCSNNPIRIIDPNGEDEWEVDKKGNITWKCESEKHQLFALDKNGKRTGESITLKNKDILNQLEKGKRTVLKGYDGNVSEEGNRREAIVGKKDVDDLLNVFKFVSDNSNVEWEFEYSKQDGKSQYSLVTDGFSNQVRSHFGSEAITSIHSHPNEPNNYQSELNSLYGDRGYLGSYPKTNMYVYMPKSTRLFNVNKNAYIRHINNDYRRFINLGR